jgi:hypothetical protein
LIRSDDAGCQLTLTPARATDAHAGDVSRAATTPPGDYDRIPVVGVANDFFVVSHHVGALHIVVAHYIAHHIKSPTRHLLISLFWSGFGRRSWF